VSSDAGAVTRTPRTVLVVDDSAFMRRVVSDLVASDPRFTVVGTARDGMEALAQVHRLAPDIVTLDVEMPVLDGLAALGYIMSEAPRPVVMLSAAEGHGGADLTIRALELGAVDFVRKPSGPISLDVARVRDRLLAALEAASCVNLRGVPILARPGAVAATVPAAHPARRAVVVAASTGGPRALAELIPRLPATLGAAVLVAQHMPRGFTRSLAERLNGMSALPVCEAEDGAPLLQNRVYVAPGGRHFLVERGGDAVVARLHDGPPLWGVRPSADPLFRTAAAVFGAATVGVVLTGMGRDGADGLLALRAAGGAALVQDQASAIVYGMPGAALRVAGADRVVPLAAMAGAVVAALATRRERHGA
jgi:two-component system chemotaxis response regulator CheB